MRGAEMSGRKDPRRAHRSSPLPSEERLEALGLAWWGVRATQSALAIVSDGRLLLANRRLGELNRALEGHRQWRALPDGRTHTHGRHPSLRRAILCEAKTLLADGGAVSRTIRLERVGAEQVIELRIERTGGHRDEAALALAYDVTDRARAEAQAERRQQAQLLEDRMRAVGELAAGMSAGLGDALGQIALRLPALRRSAGTTAPRRDDVDAIGRLVGEATRLVSRLGEFGRLRRDRPLGAVDLRAVIYAAVAAFEAEASAPSRATAPTCTISCEIGRLPPVRGVAADLRRVFAGLLDNARDAMPKGGRIRIAAHQRELGVVVTIEDEGAGLPVSQLDRIFDPFFTTKGRRSSGLGLSIAYGVMSRLGGHISAGNRRSGGAIFTMTFPRARERDAGSARQQRLELGS